MNYSDKFTQKEIKVFNEIFDLLDSLYTQPEVNNVELDKVYKGFVELLANYDVSTNECLNEDVNIEPMTLREFLNTFDFDVYKTKDADGDVVYKLRDTQGANLGNIESEEFDIDGIVNRLDIYYRDYFLDNIEFKLDDLGARIGDKAIESTWYDLSTYEDMYKYLTTIQEKYCQEEDSPEDFAHDITLLYYITNPNKLVDDAEFED